MCLSNRHLALGGALEGARIPFPEPGVPKHYAPSRTVVITHARIALSIEPADRTFRGHATLSLRALPTFTGSFALDLDDVEVQSVSTGTGEPLPFTCAEGRIHVRCAALPERVEIEWQGRDAARGMYFTGPSAWDPERQHMAWTQCQDEDAHYVFPCHDHPGVKHPWTILLDAPAGYTLLSNGQLVEQTEREGRTHAHYEQREPMPAYLFTAVVARLSVVETAWRDRSVRYLVPEGEEEGVARAMGKTPLMMETFSRLTGVDYPWPRYDQVVVHDFIFGGMENVACTTMTDLLLVPEDAVLEWDPDGLVAHELAHQWFGDLVTCQDWSQGWLNESWATFMEAVWWEADRDAADATWYRYTTAREYFEEHSSRYRRPIVSYRFREPIDVFDRHLYNKGSCVLWTLRAELGDEAFWAGVRLYLERHTHQTVHTRHFQRSLEEATGANLDGFFDQWVHAPGHPVLKVGLATRDNLLTVSIRQQQEGEDVPEAFTMHLRIVVCLEDGSEQTINLPVGERERTWAVPVDGEIKTVRIDPGLRVLAEIKLSAPEPWLVELLSDPCPVLAVRAGRALLDTDGVRVVEQVGQAAREHRFWGVRGALTRAIGQRGGPQALQHLIDALPEEADPRVCGAIYQALGSFRDARAADAMLAAADTGFGSVQEHGAFLDALGRTRDARAQARICEDLDAEGWAWWVRRKALAGLGHTEQAGALDTLIGHTDSRQPDRVRAAAAAAIGTLGDKVPEVRPRAVERLVEMLREHGFITQLGAIAALGRLRDPKALSTLAQVHRTAPDGRTRRAAYEAMVRIREGRDTEHGLARLRERVEELSEQNQKLRARIDKLEHL